MKLQEIINIDLGIMSGTPVLMVHAYLLNPYFGILKKGFQLKIF